MRGLDFGGGLKKQKQNKKKITQPMKKKKNDKSRNLFKFVSVLLSASVERVGVSRMRDFFFTISIYYYPGPILQISQFCLKSSPKYVLNKTILHIFRAGVQ